MGAKVDQKLGSASGLFPGLGFSQPVLEQGQPVPEEEILDNSHYLGEEPRSRADPEGKCSKLKYCVLELQPQVLSGGWMGGYLEICILEVQVEHPVALL